jgi:hypothetical protein
MDPISIFILILCLFIAYQLVTRTVVVVPARHVCVVERLGGSARVLHPGPRWVGVPGIDAERPFRLTVPDGRGGARVVRARCVPTGDVAYDVRPLEVITADSLGGWLGGLRHDYKNCSEPPCSLVRLELGGVFFFSSWISQLTLLDTYAVGN